MTTGPFTLPADPFDALESPTANACWPLIFDGRFSAVVAAVQSFSFFNQHRPLDVGATVGIEVRKEQNLTSEAIGGLVICKDSLRPDRHDEIVRFIKLLKNASQAEASTYEKRPPRYDVSRGRMA